MPRSWQGDRVELVAFRVRVDGAPIAFAAAWSPRASARGENRRQIVWRWHLRLCAALDDMAELLRRRPKARAFVNARDVPAGLGLPGLTRTEWV